MKMEELTPEEQVLIAKHRQKKLQVLATKELTLVVLKTAHEYQQWLTENKAGSSYSTFADEFGYQGNLENEALGIKGPTRRQIFSAVSAVLKVAEDFSEAVVY